MQATGAGGVNVTIEDYTSLVSTALKGKTGYLGVTERGEPGKLYDVGNWEQYQLELGGLVAGNDFPLYCRRALDAGGRIVVCPAGKYTIPSDKTTLLGDVAKLTITQSTTAASGATGSFSVTSAATATGTVDIIAKVPGASDVVLASAVAVTAADHANDVATAITTAINAGTGTHRFSGTPTTNTVTITAPSAFGAWGRNVVVHVLPSNPTMVGFSKYVVTFTGGSDALTATATAVFNAKTKGAAYNKVYVRAQFAASGSKDHYDLYVGITDGTVPEEVYYNVPKSGASSDMAAAVQNIQSSSRLLGTISIGATFTFQPFANTQLTGGTDGASLTATDYRGDVTAKTNIYAFGDNAEITKICVPDMADGELAKFVADYVDTRQDIMGLHRTPINAAPSRVLEYRNGTGAYNHLPIDSWRNLMFTGDIEVIDPRNDSRRVISAIGDVTGIIATKDNSHGEWWSFAGDERGVLKNVLDVNNNVGTGAWSTYADDYAVNGINPIVKDAARRVMIDGNVTMYRNLNSMLSKAEVAELLIFMVRTLKVLIPRNYNPNDPVTWKSIYRKIQPFLEMLKTGRALWDYVYEGDQDIMDVSQAVVNASPGGTSIDTGIYKLRIGIKPKVAMKYIFVQIAVTNSGVSFDIIDQ